MYLIDMKLTNEHNKGFIQQFARRNNTFNNRKYTTCNINVETFENHESEF